MLQLDGRRAPVVDLLAANNHATSSRPMDSENMSSETVYIPSVEPEMEGGVSGSPPAILDNWLQLQRALTLESLDNGNIPFCFLSTVFHFYRPRKIICSRAMLCISAAYVVMRCSSVRHVHVLGGNK